MKKQEYEEIEQYMIACMDDSAHDRDHIYRVLFTALDIAQNECGVDLDVLIAACLLHDIGRKEQFESPEKCHAMIGSEKAYAYLTGRGWTPDKARGVKECIATHRFRGDNPPIRIEAKILFDADKIDVAGTIGIARTLFYAGQISAPLYSLREDGMVLDGSADRRPSFFREYKFKLEKVYGVCCTKRGKQLADERQVAAVSFYESMLEEVLGVHKKGLELLKNELK